MKTVFYFIHFYANIYHIVYSGEKIVKVTKNMSLITTIFELLKSIVLGGVVIISGILLIGATYLIDYCFNNSSKYAGTDDVIGGWESFFQLAGGSFGFFVIILAVCLIVLVILPFVYTIVVTVYGFKTQRSYRISENQFMKRIKRESILKLISAVAGEFTMLFVLFMDELAGDMVSGMLAVVFLAELVLSIVILIRYKTWKAA